MSKSQKNRPGRPPPDDSNRGDVPRDVRFPLGGFLGKLGSMMEKLADLAESGQNLSQTGEIKGLDPQGKLRGVYGFSVKTGLGNQGEQEVKIEPFGNIRRESSGERWSRTSASRWSTFTRRTTTCWCWPRSRASARRTCNWISPGPLDDPRPARREALSQGGRPAGEFSPGDHAMGVHQRDPEDSPGSVRSERTWRNRHHSSTEITPAGQRVDRQGRRPGDRAHRPGRHATAGRRRRRHAGGGGQAADRLPRAAGLQGAPRQGAPADRRRGRGRTPARGWARRPWSAAPRPGRRKSCRWSPQGGTPPAAT